jgi:hypothetical protein
MKIGLSQLISLAVAIPKIVKNVQGAFGHEPGSVRLQHAKDAATEITATINGVTEKEVLNDAGVQALLAEGIELGVQAMKIEKRLQEIDELVKAAKGSGKPTS